MEAAALENGGDEMDRNSMRTMRFLFFGVGLVGGVILLAAGETLIGGVLVAMAAVRLVLLVKMQHGMRSSSQTGSMSGRPGGGRQMLQRLARVELAVAATAIGVAPEVLRTAVNSGRPISAVAADVGVPSDHVVNAVVRDANAKVDQAVADGRMASDRASMLRTRLPNWAEKLVLQTPGMLAGSGSGTA